MNSSDLDKVLFSKYYRPLCYFAWKMVQNDSLAEDLVQDAFVSYFQNKHRVSDEEPAIKAFLYSSVRFAVFNLSRKNKTILKFWERNVFQDIADVDYEHEIIRSEFMAAIQESIAALPEGCRKVMVMSFLDGLSNEEIAEKLQLSVNTVKTQKQRGLKVLRAKLKPEHFAIFLTLFLSGN